MKKIMLIFGTRPEAIKMCPLINELKERKSFNIVVCVTGQHREMLDQVLSIFSVVPNYDLSIMKDKQTLFDITSNILIKMRSILELEKPDIVLVHGDTTTTFTVSLACFYLQIPIGHVEAGLRTYDIYSPFPEEYNRRSVSLISNYDFAPTKQAKNNLIKESKDPKNIFITGNTGIDALRTTVKKSYKNRILDWVNGRKLILITAHRRENLGQPMINMFNAINRVILENKDLCAIYPIHMNPLVRKIADDVFKNNNSIKIIEPLEVIDFHNFMNASFIILTDSGGIQEEAPSLGKPVLVMRDITERPEGVLAGTLKLVGTNEDNIYNEITTLINDKFAYLRMSRASNPYGDGLSSKRIANILEKILYK